MAQNVNLSVSGIYTAPSDLAGLPPGALEEAVNVECRYKNLLESRRGFEELEESEIPLTEFVRMTNFPVADLDRVVALNDDGDLLYYDATVPEWVAVPGFTTGIQPSGILAKSRFIRGGQNLYLTTLEGVLSLASENGSLMIPAGVPSGLDLQAETNGDTSGFFTNNVVLSTTANITNTSVDISGLADRSGIAVDQYVTGTATFASLVVQDLTYTAVTAGTAGNSVTITYTGGGTAGAEVVSVVLNAISVQIQSGVSTATQVRTAVLASGAAVALVGVVVSGTGGTAQVTAASAPLAGGLANNITAGARVSAITESETVIVQTGTTAAGSTNLSALVSNAGIVAGLLVSGDGIPDGTTVVSIGGGGPYTVVLSNNAFQTGTTSLYTFSTPVVVTLSAPALATASATSVSFYSGSQVAYRMVFGRVEQDIDGNTTTRLGAPSQMAIATNVSGTSTNVTVTGTIPKNSDESLTFVQLYRSEQTVSIDTVPSDQMQLVFERNLVAGDFTARVITVTDESPDSVKGIPLYTGTDREGILQANNPPPAAWDMCVFRDFALYLNTTQPSILEFTLLAVGPASGVQIGDVITITTTNGTPVVATFTGAAAENLALGEFQVVTSGTASQNITDTANSLIRVINYDESIRVHALLVSTTTDLPGQIALVGDAPTVTFTIDASLHDSAYDPVLNNVASTQNYENNGVYVSKSGELEGVPGANVLFVGDSSSPIYRGLALRDYVVVLKGDGVYKIVGTSPETLSVIPFDLTSKIIGPDTAVALNSGVWMFSDQGVVSISDAGVDAKSVPVDNQFNELIGSYLDNINENAFAVGYETDRKYILAMPENGSANFASKQFNFNYATSTWTTWNRNLKTGFIHSNEGKLYVARADTDNKGISKERKSGTYRDYADESLDDTITTVVSNTQIEFASTDNIALGDIIYQSATILSPVLEIDATTGTVTTQYAMPWTTGAVEIIKAFTTRITWKQVFGDNPAFTRQFSEGLVLFKNTQFNKATLEFVTDFSQTIQETEIVGTFIGSWGLFPWGQEPWGGGSLAKGYRFYIPANKQFGSYIVPSLTITQAWSNYKNQGLSISFENVSQEVGK